MDDATDDIGMILVGRNTRDNSQSTELSGWTRPDSISLTTPNNLIVSANNPSALTRVMSPTTMAYTGTNQHTMSGIVKACPICGILVPDPPFCMSCGAWGHTHCLNLQLLHGFPFCGRCCPMAHQQMEEFNNTQRMEEWKRTRGEEMVRMRRVAWDSMGMASAFGEAMGGAVVVVAQSAATVLTSAVRGARNACVADLPPPVLPPPPSPPSGAIRPRRGRGEARELPAGFPPHYCEKCALNRGAH